MDFVDVHSLYSSSHTDLQKLLAFAIHKTRQCIQILYSQILQFSLAEQPLALKTSLWRSFHRLM